jgi:hypothetical protein
MSEVIVPAAPDWRVCVQESNPFGLARRPFVQIGIIAWAISADGNTVTPITPTGRVDTSGEYVVIGPEPCPFLVMPNGPFVHEHHEMARMFEHVRSQRAGAA